MKPYSVPSILMICFALFFLRGMAFSEVSAHVSSNSNYPFLHLVSKNEQPSQASYRFKKGNQSLNLQLKLQGGDVLVRMVVGQNQVVALGKITKNGNRRVTTVTKTQDGLLAYWQFALDRVAIIGSSLVLQSAELVLSHELQDCLDACARQELFNLIKADLAGKLLDKYNQTATSDAGGCGEISICTAGTLNEYDQCVQNCYDRYGN
ncbi:MAG: hypothetical protein R3D00_14410 [Bacteroidia bacterium]